MSEINNAKEAYWRGKYEGLKEAIQKGKNNVSSSGSRFWQSVMDHTIGYAVSAVFIVAVSFAGYYYLSHKVTETVTEIKQDIKGAIPHPVKTTKEWWNGKHWWNKDDNKTEETNKPVESVKVVKIEKEVSQDENKTGLISGWKEKMSGWKFWGKKKNKNNESEEK